MWIDSLKTRWLGDENVRVNRVIESPATPDRMYLTFGDGSRLHIEVRVDPPAEVEGEGEAALLANETTAVRAYGRLAAHLYKRATEENIDVDFTL